MENRRAHLSRLVRTVTWHRRLLAAGLAAAAVALGIEAVSPAPPESVEVPVAARDLDGGVTIAAADLTTASYAPGTAPEGLVDAHDAVGRVLAAPVRAGEPMTDRRFVGPDLLDGWGEELVATPVRVADAGATTLVRPGDRINLLAASADGMTATRVVATGVPVLTVSATDDGALAEGALLVVGATTAEAAELAQATVTARLSFTIG